MFYIFALFTGLTLTGLTLMLVPWLNGSQDPERSAHGFVRSLRGFNLLLTLLVVGMGLLWFFAPVAVQAAVGAQNAPTDPYASLSAAIAVGLGSLGAAYAVGTTGAAAIGVIAEKPEAFGRVLIFVGLSEGIAIYGLIIAFMAMTR